MDLTTTLQLALRLVLLCRLASASYKIPGSDSSVVNLWSNFELQLQDAVFEALERQSHDSAHRAIREVDSSNTLGSFTGFIPNLQQHREQLVVDSVELGPTAPICLDSNGRHTMLIDSMRHHRWHYAVASCGDGFTLFRLNSSDLIVLERISLPDEVVSLTHVAMTDPATGSARLFLLILTTQTIEIYTSSGEILELVLSQELLHQHIGLKVFNLRGSIYCVMVKKSTDNQFQPGVYEIAIDKNRVSFNFLSSKVVFGEFPMQMCLVHHKTFMFQPMNQTHFGIYELELHQFEHHQIIDAADIKEFACFHVGATHYLALATSKDVRMFQYIDGFFEFVQSVDKPGVTSISAIYPPTYRDEAFLVVSAPNSVNSLFLDALSLTFQLRPLNCETDSAASNSSCWKELASLDFGSSTTFQWHDKAWMIAPVPTDGSVQVVAFGAHLEPAPSPVIKQFANVQKRMETSAKAAQLIQARSQHFTQVAEDIVLYGSDVRLEGSWEVGTLVVPSTPVKSLENVEFNQKVWMSGLVEIVDGLQARVDELEKLVARIESRIERSILNGTEEDVQFERLTVEGSLIIERLSALNLSLEWLNGQDFNNLVTDIVQRDSERLMESLRVMGTLTTDALAAVRVNGFLVEDAATSNNEVHIVGDLLIDDYVQVNGDVLVEGTVNDIDLSEQLVTPEHLFDEIRFEDDVVVDELEIDGHIDGVNVSSILPNVVYNYSNRSAHFNRMHLDKLIVEGDVIVASRMIGDIDVEALNSTALRLDAMDLMPENSSIDFSQGVVIQSPLEVGSINNVPFDDFLLKNSTDLSDVTLKGVKSFEGVVHARNLTVDGLINGHLLQDAFTLDTNQSVNGTIELQSGFDVSESDLHIGSLNGANWLAVMEHGVHPALLAVPGLAKNVTITAPCTIDGTLHSGHLTATGEVEHLNDIFNDLVFNDENDIVITGKKTLPSWTVSSLHVDGLVNGYKVLEDLLTVNSDQLITGHYRLGREVEFSDLNVTGWLNEYQLDTLLGNVLIFEGDETVVRSKLMFDMVTVTDELTVVGSINGVRTERILQNGPDQNFTAMQILISPNFRSHLSIDGNVFMLDPLTKVNDIDLDVLDRRRVTRSTDQWISGEWKLSRANVSSLSFKKLNGLTVDQWKRDFIRSHSSTTQVINAQSIDLDSFEVMGSIVTSPNSGINGYDLAAMNRTAGDIRGDVVFTSDTAFDRIESRQMAVKGNLNRQSLKKLKDHAVYVDQPLPPIAGTKTFQTLRVNGNVEAKSINGRRLIETYLHASQPQTIVSPVHVESMVAGDVNFTGEASTLNGVPSSILSDSQTLPYNIHRGDVVLEKPINVSSLVIPSLQGEKWNELVNSLAFLNKTNQFNGTVTFTNLLNVRNGVIAKDVNGVDLKAFAKDVVLLDTDAVITARKSFEAVMVHKLTTPNVTCGSVSPDVIGTAKGAIRLYVDTNATEINVTISFTDLLVRGDVRLSTLNGRPFPDGYMTVNGSQELASSLVADRVIVLGDILLEEGARVNGFDLEAELANTWMVDGNRDVLSKKTFSGQVTIKSSLSVDQNVNGIANFSQQVVELSEGGTVYGAAQWKDAVVDADVRSVELTNDIDVAELASKVAYLDEPVSSQAKWTAPQVTVTGHHFLLPVEANVNDIPFSVGQLIVKNSNTTGNSMGDLRLLEAATAWHEALRLAYFRMDHLDLDQTIFLPHQATSVSEMNINGTSFLLIGTRAGALVYVRRLRASSYTFGGIPVGVGSVSKWLPLPGTDLVVTMSTTTASSPKVVKGAKLWRIASADPVVLEKVQDFGPDVVDITGESIHNLRLSFNGSTTSRALPALSLANFTSSDGKLQVVERPKTSPAIGSILTGPFNSDMKMHTFQLGSKQMIALVMTFSADITASVVGCPGVRIYSTSTGFMRLEHIIPACDVRAIGSFTHGNLPDTYLLLAEHEAVTVYGFEGASGFIERFRLPYPSAAALHSWRTTDDQLLVAVAKADRVAIHKAITIGDYIRD